MMQTLENRWKCNICNKRYTPEEAKAMNNICCQKYMTKVLVLVHKP